MATYVSVYYTYLYTHTHSTLCILLWANDENDLVLPLVFILKVRGTAWSFQQNALHTSLEEQKQKNSRSEIRCEKVKLWGWSNSNNAAQCLNWITCFGRTLKCWVFYVLEHKCKKQGTMHCKGSVDTSQIGLEVQGFVFHLLQTHDCPFFPVFIPLTLIENLQFWLRYAEN